MMWRHLGHSAGSANKACGSTEMVNLFALYCMALGPGPAEEQSTLGTLDSNALPGDTSS